MYINNLQELYTLYVLKLREGKYYVGKTRDIETRLENQLEFGIDNVRGGMYVQVKLPEEVVKLLEQKFKMCSDKCVGCGSNDHFKEYLRTE